MSGGGALAKPIGSWWRWRPGREARMLAGMVAGLLLLAGAAMLAGRLPAPARAAPDYVVDSGVSVIERDIFWISNEAVVFVTGRPNQYNANVSDQIMIWRPALGRAPGAFTKLTMPGELAFSYARFLCLRDDKLFFTVREPTGENLHSRYVVRLPGADAGPIARPEILSRESFQGRPPAMHLETRSRFNKFSCDLEVLPEHIPFGHWLDLDPSHGVILVVPPRTQPEELKGKLAELYRPSSTEPQPIEVDRSSITTDSARVTFYPYKGAYFLGPRQISISGPDACVPAWWLWPDGRAEGLCLPPRDKSRYHWPTRLGVLLGRWDHDTYGNVRTSGLYLYAQDKLVWLLPGFTDKLAVSPDGCKVAFPHAEGFLDWPQYGRTRLKMIDLCRHAARLLPSGAAGDKPPMRDRFADQ